jgi:hypothetical protein
MPLKVIALFLPLDCLKAEREMLDRYQPVARKTAFTLRNVLTLLELITEDHTLLQLIRS